VTAPVEVPHIAVIICEAFKLTVILFPVIPFDQVTVDEQPTAVKAIGFPAQTAALGPLIVKELLLIEITIEFEFAEDPQAVVHVAV
jgi:hypothetical protein